MSHTITHMKFRYLLTLLTLLLLVSLLCTACAKDETSDKDVLITNIVLDGDELQVKDDGTHYVIPPMGEGGVWRYQIKYHVYPKNASNKDVDFILVSANPYATIDEETATVTLTKAGVATVLLKGKGQSEASITLEIWAQ